MQQHDAEPLDVSHTHDDGGFDVELPSFKSDALLWVMTALSAAYLAYLIWSELRQKKTRLGEIAVNDLIRTGQIVPFLKKPEPVKSPPDEPPDKDL